MDIYIIEIYMDMITVTRQIISYSFIFKKVLYRKGFIIILEDIFLAEFNIQSAPNGWSYHGENKSSFNGGHLWH